jgi:NADH dehydrogenase
MLRETLGVRRPIIHVPPTAGYLIASSLNPLLRDVVITREEIKGLMRGLLDSDAPPAGPTRVSDWAREHKDQLGRRYASEVGRRTQRAVAYERVR